MKYLLDTCVISEIVKPCPNKLLLEWLMDTPSDRLYLSVLTIGEIRKGIAKLPSSKKKANLSEWLNTLIEDYKDRILPVDLTVSENWGEMQGYAEKNGLSFPTIDGLLASIARTHNLVLVTRNESDFQGCNIPLFNPWKVDKNDKK
ncbi:MAG TPA: type II toxin-antitoxin system VapC family toxin [Candidatus Rifleibacterium sp.]|nr:type II toxin-antitoxin system VapC family toxin [Candidatus Rifleibacterium sp.]HPT47457.1 type II toxin-antitoxin system VapC family toxin [Candidatus Rifleibacterium sp.]